MHGLNKAPAAHHLNNPPEAHHLNNAPAARRPFYSLLFTSTMRMDLRQPADLDRMAALSQRVVSKNAKAGLTGVLLFSNARFVQALEGERQRVQTLFDRIRQDDRHCNVNLLAAQFSTARRFAGCVAHYVGADEAVRRHYGPVVMPSHPLLEFMVDVAREEGA